MTKKSTNQNGEFFNLTPSLRAFTVEPSYGPASQKVELKLMLLLPGKFHHDEQSREKNRFNRGHSKIKRDGPGYFIPMEHLSHAKSAAFGAI